MSTTTEQQPWDVAANTFLHENSPQTTYLTVLIKTAAEQHAANETSALQDRLSLYESAQELITTPNGRVWIAAEKHEATVGKVTQENERLREELETHRKAYEFERDSAEQARKDRLVAENQLQSSHAALRSIRAELQHTANTLDSAIVDEDWSADDFKIRVESVNRFIAKINSVLEGKEGKP